jgi:hypothetical protein
MKTGDLVIVADLGEMKVYKATPRDLEAEAGLKPDHVKLDLVDAKDYVASHWKVSDIVTDEAGRFKGGGQGRGSFTQGSVGERHGIEQKIEAEVIAQLAEDITSAVRDNAPGKWYLALPETIYRRVMERVDTGVKETLAKGLEKDLIKKGKNELLEFFTTK